MNLDRNKHAVYLLYFHLILVTKYRKNVINNQISKSLKEIFIRIALKNNISLEEWNHGNDHIHALIKINPMCDIKYKIKM